MLEKISMIDSQVLRALAISIVALLGLILSWFGVNVGVFTDEATKFVDGLLLVLATGGTVWAGYARAMKANPPLTDAAVKHAQEIVGKSASCWLAMGLAVCFAFSLMGCVTMEPPKGFHDEALIAEQQVNGLIQSATDALNSGAIKSDDAQYTRDTATRTRDLLLTAETAYDAGDVSTAEGRLSLATSVLRELQRRFTPTPPKDTSP